MNFKNNPNKKYLRFQKLIMNQKIIRRTKKMRGLKKLLIKFKNYSYIINVYDLKKKKNNKQATGF